MENLKGKPINPQNRLLDDLNVPEPTPNGIRKMGVIIRRRIRLHGWIITLRWLYVILLSQLFGYVPLRYSQITPQLYVGSQHGFWGKLRLRMAGLTASVNLREEFDDAEKSLLFEDYLYIPVPDETPVSIEQLHKGIAFIQQVINKDGKVYVHCASGVGRSVMLVIAYLIQDGMTFEQALARVSEVRPFIYLFPSQHARLQEFENEVR
jgi:hypothetical protein